MALVCAALPTPHRLGRMIYLNAKDMPLPFELIRLKHRPSTYLSRLAKSTDLEDGRWSGVYSTSLKPPYDLRGSSTHD